MVCFYHVRFVFVSCMFALISSLRPVMMRGAIGSGVDSEIDKTLLAQCGQALDIVEYVDVWRIVACTEK